MERFDEMGDSTRGQAAAGPGQMSRDGDTLRTGRVSGRTCIMRAGTLVIMCRVIVEFSKLSGLKWVSVDLSLGSSTGSVLCLAGLSLALSFSVSTLGGSQGLLFGEDL